jgi:hypothetical protein
MTVRLASEQAPGRPANEDHGFAVAGLVGVLDGVSVFDGVETGCHHGPAWYVQRLSEHLIDRHRVAAKVPLTQILADSITDTRSDHGGKCDLDHRGTPASTVCLLRENGDHVEYLVLADSPLVLDRGEVEVIADDRFETAVARLREVALTGENGLDSAAHAAQVRQTIGRRQQLTNTPDGYWIAAANPDAAYKAVTGSAPLDGPDRVRRAALLTDGASAAVEQFELLDWRGLLDLLTQHGPQELIRQVRAAENADHDGSAQPRYKRHDDATAALCTFEVDQQ